MKQQVFVIPGGDAFATYDEYMAFLTNYEVSLKRLRTVRWRSKLPDSLGDGFDVYVVEMPNRYNAKYPEWKIWFEKHLLLMDETIILIGTSLGAVFLAKYMSENSLSKNVRATFLVAPPYGEDGGRKLPEFAITTSLKKLGEQGGSLFFYHSKDDPVVAFSELAKFQQELPNATYRVFEDRQHFNQEDFPEIVEDIKNLAL